MRNRVSSQDPNNEAFIARSELTAVETGRFGDLDEMYLMQATVEDVTREPEDVRSTANFNRAVRRYELTKMSVRLDPRRTILPNRHTIRRTTPQRTNEGQSSRGHTTSRAVRSPPSGSADAEPGESDPDCCTSALCRRVPHVLATLLFQTIQKALSHVYEWLRLFSLFRVVHSRG